MKVCTCCTRKYEAAEWAALPCLGIVADEVETIELKNCACGSTLAVVVPSCP